MRSTVPTSKWKGFILVLTGASCWGIGGTVAQKLFQMQHIDVNWYVTVRLLCAGILLLLLQSLTGQRSQIVEVWKTTQTALSFILFGLVGMLAVQYTYMASIDQGNAAVATLLQYLSPVMIMIYMVLRKQSRLTVKLMTCGVLALTGCFLLLTNGSLSQLSVSQPAVIWGLLSGVSAAFYTLYAVKLLKTFDSLVVVGWAMIIGGLGMSFVHAPWKIDLTLLTPVTCGYLLFSILIGTLLAFWFYIASLNYLTPQETSLLGSAEPLAAVGTTVFWLHEPFGVYQWLGTGCIIILIIVLQIKRSSPVSA
ncbi:EamA family transporter [Paenibacillus barcinonensis]|uniref:DMT family transporter n=1 Tax=Paenibacillus barcinonensis TaxID=198119 RepID=UPI001C1204E6|nr:EamA family transporter [Paenibacillus barcinonensis]MBU5352469.1 EamA family transporter [Paenibacillus barcinonensis]